MTLNGRQLPAASVGTITGNPTSAGSQGNSRSFDFATLASEGVSGLEVYKTGNAATPSGGMGATINIKTIRPLESGNKSSIGVKAVMDGGADNEVTPEVSGLFSWANDSETIGFAAFASYQDRKPEDPWRQRRTVSSSSTTADDTVKLPASRGCSQCAGRRRADGPSDKHRHQRRADRA